jgi:hypothetical protein
VSVHHLHRIVVAGRDTCDGSCETRTGCNCTGRFVDTVPVQPAEACTEVGAEPRGKHRTTTLARWALKLRRLLG